MSIFPCSGPSQMPAATGRAGGDHHGVIPYSGIFLFKTRILFYSAVQIIAQGQ